VGLKPLQEFDCQRLRDTVCIVPPSVYVIWTACNRRKDKMTGSSGREVSEARVSASGSQPVV
jgi:hypothetical protein